MKKADIISAYNGLAPQLKKALANYQTVIGKEHPSAGSMMRPLNPNAMNWGKDILESMLRNRERDIKKLNETAGNYVKNQTFLATEEGKEFVASMKEREKELRQEIRQVAEEFQAGINKTLASVGLEGWEIAVRPAKDDEWPKYLPTFRTLYFDIRMKDNPYAYLHVTIEHTAEGCGWKMSLNSCMRGEQDITVKDEQYQQFKAYVTICEHPIVFESWMSTIYCELAHKAGDLINELDKIIDSLQNPYDTYMESK